MSSIADLFFGFHGDDKELQVDAARAGDKAGKTLGDRLGASSKAGFAALGATIAGVVGIAAKGGHELANAMADFRAETGATEEEAAAAQKTLVGLYKTNTDGFETLGKVLTVVHNDMGLVGEDAKKAAQLVLDFAHVTGTDAVDAARQLDDATDAFNLTAAQQVDLLDKLVKSQQIYGGSVDAHLQTLIAMGPALKAANLGYDEGIGFLNLFEKAGVDADIAAKALTKSLTKVKSPAELRNLIADIAKTVDPLERAQKASDLFGAKAGPALAAALAQGTGSLSEFTPAVTDAAGATAKAADIIENKFTNRLKILFHGLTGDLDGLVSGVEPVVATLAYLPKAITTVSAALGLLVLRNNQATASMVLSAVATKAQAIAYLLLHPQYLLTAIQLGILTIAQGVYTVATGLATAATTALGIAMKLIPIFAIIAAVVLLYEAWENNFGGIRDIVGNVVGFIVEHLGFLFPLLDALGKAVSAVLGFIGGIVGAVGDAVDHALNDANRAADAAATETTRIVSDHLRSEREEMYNAAAYAASGISDGIRSEAPAAAEATHTVSQAGVDVLKAERRLWAEEARRAATSIGQEIRYEGPSVHRAMGNLLLAGAQGIRDKRSAIDSALDQLKTDIKNRMSRTAEIGKLTGQLLGKTLADHLRDADPLVKKQAEGTRDLIEARLLELGAKTGAAGKKAQEELEKGLHSKDPDIRRQAERTKSLLDAGLTKKTGPNPGDVIGDQLNSDLGRKGTLLGKTAYQLGRTIFNNLYAGVKGTAPTGSAVSSGPQGGTTPGGVKQFALGTTYVPYDMLAQIHQGEAVLNPTEAATYRAVGLGREVPLIGELNVDARGHKDPAGVGAAVKQAIGEAMADVLRDESIRGYMGTTP